MVKAKTAVRFIISCPARSGSTMLNVLLASHPDIICHSEALVGDDAVGFLAGEFANKRKLDPAFDKYLIDLRDTNPGRFLDEVIFNPQEHSCVGAKFKTDEAFLERYAPLQTIIRDESNIKILMLSRRNVLAQYVSHLIVARQTGIYLLRGDDKLPRTEPVEIDVGHCLDYVRDIVKRQNMAAKEYVNHPVLDIHYEDLVFNKNETVFKILEFLKVGAHELTTDTKKILPQPSEIVTNFKEIVEALIGSGLVCAADLRESGND